MKTLGDGLDRQLSERTQEAANVVVTAKQVDDETLGVAAEYDAQAESYAGFVVAGPELTKAQPRMHVRATERGRNRQNSRLHLGRFGFRQRGDGVDDPWLYVERQQPRRAGRRG